MSQGVVFGAGMLLTGSWRNFVGRHETRTSNCGWHTNFGLLSAAPLILDSLISLHLPLLTHMVVLVTW